MNMDRKVYRNRIIFTILTALCVAFIFTQSLLPASASGAESGRVVDFINYLCELIGIGFTFTGHFVRKCAHFTEFAILGISAFFTFKSYFSKYKLSALFALTLCVAVAVSDECLQLISAGRVCSFGDMIIDSSGSAVGILISVIFYLFLSRRNRCEKGDDYGI